jgi:hypothetical protein
VDSSVARSVDSECSRRLVALDELLRHGVERVLEHPAVVVLLVVGRVHGPEQRANVARAASLGSREVALHLAQQQAVGGHHDSASVVMVIVWLCSSQRALGVCGEISP